VKAAPYLVMAQELFIASLPYFIKAYEWALGLWKALEPYNPLEALPVVIGITMAFLGGEFPLLMAAVEAYRQIGWEPSWKAVQRLYGDANQVLQKTLEDDKKDDDGDGIPDVLQVTQSEYVQRKTMLVLRTLDPQSCTEAVEAITCGAVAVIAVLKVQFARVLALGASIGDCLKRPALEYCLPKVKPFLHDDLQKWAEPAVCYLCKVIAITLAWWVQRIISAFHSAIRGGHMAGKGVVQLLHSRGFIKATPDDTYADEIAGYAIAAVGFLWQLSMGFHLAFYYKLLLLPFTFSECMLRWVVAA